MITKNDMKTTLKEIARSAPCWDNRNFRDNWNLLVTNLGYPELVDNKNSDDIPDVEVSIRFILENNSWNYTKLAVSGSDLLEIYDREFRLLSVFFVRKIKHLMEDQRARDAVDVAYRYAIGEATISELTQAQDGAFLVYQLDRTVSRPSDCSWPLCFESATASFAWVLSEVAPWASYESSTPREKDHAFYTSISSQIEEFKRMLDCIENGQVYNI